MDTLLKNAKIVLRLILEDLKFIERMLDTWATAILPTISKSKITYELLDLESSKSLDKLVPEDELPEDVLLEDILYLNNSETIKLPDGLVVYGKLNICSSKGEG